VEPGSAQQPNGRGGECCEQRRSAAQEAGTETQAVPTSVHALVAQAVLRVARRRCVLACVLHAAVMVPGGAQARGGVCANPAKRGREKEPSKAVVVWQASCTVSGRAEVTQVGGSEVICRVRQVQRVGAGGGKVAGVAATRFAPRPPFKIVVCPEVFAQDVAGVNVCQARVLPRPQAGVKRAV